MIYNVKPKNNLATFAIVFNGSIDYEYKGVYGIAHLMEHLQCKNFEHLIDSLDKDGIDWNAYTSGSKVAFYFSGLSKHLKFYKEDLYNLIPQFKLTQENLDSERKIVLQEYEEGFGDQTSAFIMNWYRKHWGCFQPLGINLDLESITLKDCEDFFEKQYRYPSLVINIDHDTWKTSMTDNPNVIPKPYAYSKEGYDVPLEEMPHSQQTDYRFVSQVFTNGKENYYKFLARMYSDGLKSPLYKVIREDNQLCYRITMDVDNFNDRSEYQVSVDLSSTEDADKVRDVVAQGLDTSLLTKERFELCKHSFILDREKIDENRHTDWEKYTLYPSELVSNIIYTMTYDEIIDAAKELQFDMFSSKDL